MEDIIDVSLGILAHNEEKNIEDLLLSIEKQELDQVRIAQILVVSSGSSDRTNQILRRWQKTHKNFKVTIELYRKGKAAAVNTFLTNATAPVVITISGDLVLDTHAIEEIGVFFMHKDVGMAGAHPIPQNIDKSTIGSEVELLWELHHRVSLQQPKCGEMVAFRNIVNQIPDDSAVDEATLEILLRLLGYEIVYAPRSLVYNKGPLNRREFIQQRRRVYAGHQWVEQKYTYTVATMKTGLVSKVLLDYVFSNPKIIGSIIHLLLLETYARVLGWIDYHIFNRNPYVWRMISR